jgi:hypothetical protein
MFCPAPTTAVGAALLMSNNGVNSTPSPSAHGLEIACAQVSADATGGHTGSATLVELDPGSNTGAGFTPATMSPLAMCPPGAIMTGMLVHGGPTAQETILFVDAFIQCAPLEANGDTGAPGSVPIMNTGSGGSDDESHAACGPNEAITLFATNMGAGLDSFELYCAPIICE